MPDCMIDLETFGTSLNAVIVSIGAVVFDPNGADSYDDLMTVKDSLKPLYLSIGVNAHQPNRIIDAKTVFWWLEQSDTARHSLTQLQSDSVPLERALDTLAIFFSRHKVRHVWSHGVTFDLMILQHAYEQLDKKPPWHFTAMRDTRTLFGLLSETELAECWIENPLKHSAVSDAACQAIAVQRAIKSLGVLK